MRVVLLVGLLSSLPMPTAAQDGPDVARRYSCASCHTMPEVQASRGSDCVGCHQQILSRPRRGRAPHIEHYVHAPNLTNVTRRLSDEYLVAFIQDPHDVRPRLEETMPRLPVTEADAQILVGWLRSESGEVSAPRSPAPSASNVTAGRRVFEREGCAACHEMGNLDFGVNIPPAAFAGLDQAAYEAPNLRFVRDRMDPDVALQWLRDPSSIDPNTQMPDPELSESDARLIRDFLFLADLGTAARAPSASSYSDLTVLDRPVRFGEVRRIFQQSCIHCHAHTDARANSAFGFSAASLDLSSAAGVRAGVQLPDGTSRSILEPGADGVPPLMARLLRRHEEAGRDFRMPRRDPLYPVVREQPTEAVGMPLGLPPVSSMDLKTLRTWIEQGAPD